MRISNQAFSISTRRVTFGRRLFFSIFLFSILALGNGGIFTYFILNTLGEKMATEAYQMVGEEAGKLRERIERYYDRFTVHSHIREIFTYFNSVLVRKEIIRKICLLDPAGTPVLELDRSGETLELTPVPDHPRGPANSREAAAGKNLFVRDSVNTVATPIKLQGEKPWEIQVELDAKALDEKIAALRRELILKILLGSGVSLALLAIAFLYVLKQIRARERLERESAQRERMALIGTLVSGLAHEIKNPLNAVSMNIQLLQEELSGHPSTSDDVIAILKGTSNELQRLLKMFNDFLLYARPEKLQLAKKDINQLLDEIIFFMDPEFSKKGITVKRDFNNAVPPIEMDELKMRQAILNVLLNAIQAVPEKGQIVVRTGMSGEAQAFIEIQDNGHGIPQKEIPNIFKAFHSTKRGGTGLGLPITLNIVENHNGTIEVQSEPGKGAVFRIILPLEIPTAA